MKSGDARTLDSRSGQLPCRGRPELHWRTTGGWHVALS